MSTQAQIANPISICPLSRIFSLNSRQKYLQCSLQSFLSRIQWVYNGSAPFMGLAPQKLPRSLLFNRSHTNFFSRTVPHRVGKKHTVHLCINYGWPFQKSLMPTSLAFHMSIVDPLIGLAGTVQGVSIECVTRRE